MLKRGDAVISLAGRDRNELLAVAAADAQGVTLCNGKDRPLARPKRKNPKHISPAGAVIDTDGLTNKKLRRLISQYSTRTDSQQTENL